MKTIKERAKEYSLKDFDGYYTGREKAMEEGYIAGATEQKAIDNEELLKLKSAWEKQAQINHNDEDNYNQGYHDAVEKACEWLGNYLMEIGYPDDWLRDSLNIKSGKERFRKAMEEQIWQLVELANTGRDG